MTDNLWAKGQASRPVVPIFTLEQTPDHLAAAIGLGLEEEGIPWECQKTSSGGVTQSAKQAADLSKLNVGLAVDGPAQTVVLHHRDLRQDQPLFVLTPEAFTTEALRRLGANAARLVKGNPLLMPEPGVKEHRPARTTRESGTASEDPAEAMLHGLTKQIIRILKELNTPTTPIEDKNGKKESGID